MPRPWIVLVGFALWSCGTALSARTSKNRHHPKARDVPAGPRVHAGEHGGGETGSETDFLANFAGKKRLWVITAPSYNDNYLRMMEKQIEESEGLNCRLAERDTLIVTIIQNAMMEGKIKYTTIQGQANDQPLDSDLVTKLLHYLELEHQLFSMLLLKKNLKIEEIFPYPVRVQAVLEVIDQLPLRKLERLSRKGSKCKITKRRLVVKQLGVKKKKIFSSHKHGNLTSVFPSRRKSLDKKAAIRNRVQDILSGRSRFVIRKPSAAPAEVKSKPKPDIKRDRAEPKARHKQNTMKIKDEEGQKSVREKQPVDQPKSKKKGKGQKGKGKKKKREKGGKKSQREAEEKEKAALKELMENLQGKRRLLVISSPSDVSSQYIQQRDNNDLHSCELALRKVTALSILGSEQNPSMHLQHYQPAGDPQLASLPDITRNPDLVSLVRKRYGLASKEFSMVVTDYDLRPNPGNVFHAATSPLDLIKYIDSFRSRQADKEMEASSVCGPSETKNDAENSLLRFMSKRRLLIVSTPTEDDYSFHQQLQALIGQECPMGVRHFALLKLVGRGPDVSGTVKLFPLNGKSQSEKESLSPDVVKNLRDQLKIRPDYFSMLVVGKDGDVKAWFPSPMWNLASVYDLVDSMELRQQEEQLQQSLGIYCPEEGGGAEAGAGAGAYHGGGNYPGYAESGEDGYRYHRSEE